MSVSFTSIPEKILARPILSTDVVFVINNIQGWDGNALTSADFGTQAWGAFFNSRFDEMEIFEFDPATIADNAISFVSRGLMFNGTNTSVAGNKKDWPAGTIIQIGSDIPQIMMNLKLLTDLDTDVTLAANSDTKLATQKAIKAYYDALVFSTIADAALAVKGKFKLSAAPVSPTNPIALGENDPRLPTQGENDAMAGTSGTPGSSNKFVTETDTGLTNNMNLTTDQSVAGVKTFTSIPVSSLGVPINANDLSTKGYVDSK